MQLPDPRNVSSTPTSLHQFAVADIDESIDRFVCDGRGREWTEVTPAGGGDQRPARTPPLIRARAPETHQLHRSIATRDRRLQTPTTPSFAKSLLWSSTTTRSFGDSNTAAPFVQKLR